MYWRVPLIVLALVTSLLARDRIVYIDFFGYRGVDADAVRVALPFREGNKVAKNLSEQARAAVKRVRGRDATDVARVCCTGDGDSVIFVGLPGTSSQVVTHDPAPQGNVTPPPELTTLYLKMTEAEYAAIKKGIS